MPQHTTPRQPLSCENCRKRKIKCQSGQVPCATCVKRGHAQTCYYKRNADVPQHSHPNESELLHRVRNLEDLLKQQIQIAQSSQSPTELRGGAIPTRSNENSPRSGSETPSVTTRARQTGTIVTSPAGYQHFVGPQPAGLKQLPILLRHDQFKKCASGYTASSSAVR
jgi:hypothetical protein